MMTSLSDNLSRPNLTKFKEPWRQFEDTEANTNIDTTSKMDIIDNSEVPQINKRLVFDVSDGYDEEDEDHSGSHDNAEIKNKPIKSRSSDGIIRKRIDFGSSEDDVHDRDPSPIRHLDFDSDSEDSESGINQKKLTVVSSAFKSRVTIPTCNMKDRKVASESCICIRSSPHRAMEFGDYNPCISYKTISNVNKLFDYTYMKLVPFTFLLFIESKVGVGVKGFTFATRFRRFLDCSLLKRSMLGSVGSLFGFSTPPGADLRR